MKILYKSGVDDELPDDVAIDLIAKGQAFANEPVYSRSQEKYGEITQVESPIAQREAAISESIIPSSSGERIAAEHAHEGFAGELSSFGLGAARTITLGLSDVIANKLGVDLRGFEMASPFASIAGETAGFALPGGALGVSGRLGKAAESLVLGKKAVGTAEKAFEKIMAAESSGAVTSALARRVAARSLGTAVEAMPYGVGNFVSNVVLGREDAAAEYLLSDIGLMALIGGTLGGGLLLSKELLSGAEGLVERGIGKISKSITKETESPLAKEAMSRSGDITKDEISKTIDVMHGTGLTGLSKKEAIDALDVNVQNAARTGIENSTKVLKQSADDAKKMLEEAYENSNILKGIEVDSNLQRLRSVVTKDAIVESMSPKNIHPGVSADIIGTLEIKHKINLNDILGKDLTSNESANLLKNLQMELSRSGRENGVNVKSALRILTDASKHDAWKGSGVEHLFDDIEKISSPMGFTEGGTKRIGAQEAKDVADRIKDFAQMADRLGAKDVVQKIEKLSTNASKSVEEISSLIDKASIRDVASQMLSTSLTSASDSLSKSLAASILGPVGSAFSFGSIGSKFYDIASKILKEKGAWGAAFNQLSKPVILESAKEISNKKLTYDFDQSASAIRYAAQTPGIAEKAAAPIAAMNPKLGAAFTSKIKQGVEMLAARIPKVTSPMEKQKFLAALEVVDNPKKAFSNIVNGKSTIEAAIAFREYYQNIFGEIATQMISDPESLSYKDKIKYSRILGVPLGKVMNPDFILDQQIALSNLSSAQISTAQEKVKTIKYTKHKMQQQLTQAQRTGASLDQIA